jgi:hypothetical protein
VHRRTDPLRPQCTQGPTQRSLLGTRSRIDRDVLYSGCASRGGRAADQRGQPILPVVLDGIACPRSARSVTLDNAARESTRAATTPVLLRPNQVRDENVRTVPPLAKRSESWSREAAEINPELFVEMVSPQFGELQGAARSADAPLFVEHVGEQRGRE